MSTAHQEAHAAAAHDVSDHHGFDGEPARALPADEPPTPSWLPALGLALFAVAGVTFLVMSSDGSAADQAAPAGARQAPADARQAPADARPLPADARPAATMGARPAPGANARPAPGADARPAGARPVAPTGPASGPAAETLRAAAERTREGGAAPGPANLRKLTPQEVDAVRKRMDARQKDAAKAPPPAPPK
ncbi:hypothetical protein WME75_40455 [Sorangium sp. So ce1014]|uniref:hypothetical protein n=1 Tax=Sorangium sp. So ce1014 TaxID=3133326 RepID=UPI003F620603